MKITKLFRTHCPACDQAERMLQKANLDHESINVESPEGEEWITRLNVRNLPVIIIEDNNGAQKILLSIPELKEWLANNSSLLTPHS